MTATSGSDPFRPAGGLASRSRTYVQLLHAEAALPRRASPPAGGQTCDRAAKPLAEILSSAS